MHVIARRRTDAAWPRPVLGLKPPLAYDQERKSALIGSLRRLLGPAGLNAMDR